MNVPTKSPMSAAVSDAVKDTSSTKLDTKEAPATATGQMTALASAMNTALTKADKTNTPAKTKAKPGPKSGNKPAAKADKAQGGQLDLSPSTSDMLDNAIDAMSKHAAGDQMQNLANEARASAEVAKAAADIAEIRAEEVKKMAGGLIVAKKPMSMWASIAIHVIGGAAIVGVSVFASGKINGRVHHGPNATR